MCNFFNIFGYGFLVLNTNLKKKSYKIKQYPLKFEFGIFYYVLLFLYFFCFKAHVTYSRYLYTHSNVLAFSLAFLLFCLIIKITNNN